MLLFATVDRVFPNRLIVTDRRTFQRLIVNTRMNTRCLFPGDVVTILTSGSALPSFPPQVFAVRIQRISPRRGHC